ncbi:MAG: hypothetical protein E6Q61_02575 [Nitrosomonas sp.]|nr:MAG: hypothetical protein E6Q61_02575 [Nitrosomonas sp.]
MKISRKILAGVIVATAIGTGFVYANSGGLRAPVEFFKGHTHDSEGTHGAPSHSGGTDRNGCHNGSVPYHCH